MGTGDLFGDFRERRILVPAYSNPSSATVTVWVRPCHSRTSRAPGFRLRPGSGVTRPSVRNIFARILQLAPRRFAEPAMLDFLEPVADSSDQHVTTDPWRLAPIKLSPFAAKLFEVGVVQGVR